MKARRSIAILALIGLLTLDIAKPRAALAGAAEDIALAGLALAAYVVVVIIGTHIAFDKDLAPANAEDPAMRYDNADGSVRFGNDCQQKANGVTVACW